VNDGIVIHPATGEITVLNAPVAELARWLAEARELDRQMKIEKQRITDELLARMDSEASYTLRSGGLEIKGDGPVPPTEYDAQALYTSLQEYVEAGVITKDALERAVVPQPVTYKARTQGLKALEKLNGGIVQAIQRHARPTEDYRRRVNVKTTPQDKAS
jgi:hypothetical protein